MLLVKNRVGIFVFKTASNYGLFIKFITRIKNGLRKISDFIYDNIKEY